MIAREILKKGSGMIEPGSSIRDVIEGSEDGFI
jgi:hypothetical protein